MYILGINGYHGDAAAALKKDGQLIACVEEERFRRIKRWQGFWYRWLVDVEIMKKLA